MLAVRCASVVLGAVSAIAVAGCDKAAASASPDAGVSEDPSRVASCDRVRAASVCSEYSGSYLAERAKVLGASCQKLGGSFAEGACPNTTVLGACALPTGEVRRLYAGGATPFDAAGAVEECRATYRGVWSPTR